MLVGTCGESRRYGKRTVLCRRSGDRALFVRPRACFLARSFSGSEKWRVRKPKNHLLCKWIRMLQLTEKPPML